jgi:carbonic anhydrase
MNGKNSRTPKQALNQLIAGNERYLSGSSNQSNASHETTRKALVNGQSPVAAVLGCSDSRTPPELIFDAGLGDLFVCRNAGNLLDEAIIGSLEYVVAHAGASLIVVMGHTNCGAFGAAVNAVSDPTAYESRNIEDIIQRLLPAVLKTQKSGQSDPEWVDAAAKQNVVDSLKKIRSRSRIIAEKIGDETVDVVGAWYDLESGKVTILDA